MKKLIRGFCILMLLVSFTACGVEFDGSRMGNDKKFDMEYKILNKTDSQDLKAEAGDIIHGKIVTDGGDLSIKIQKDGDDPIYESNGIAVTNEFDVQIKDAGIYKVTVIGKKAKGSVNFVVKANE